jgi:hypothetical protein
LNHRPLGYEPSKLPLLHSDTNTWLQVHESNVATLAYEAKSASPPTLPAQGTNRRRIVNYESYVVETALVLRLIRRRRTISRCEGLQAWFETRGSSGPLACIHVRIAYL